MTKKISMGIISSLLVLICSCSAKTDVRLADPNATDATKALYQKLVSATQQGFLVGHQDDAAYGVGWKYEEGKTTSDVQMVCGDYPALYGWDLGGIENDNPNNLDTVYFDLIRKLIVEANSRGGVSTLSWHVNNPVTGETAWSEKQTLKYIFENDTIMTKYIGWLGKVAVFFKSLKDENGDPIPVIFRPWHEWTGGWFWWGTPHSSNEEFIAFWKLTVETLRDKYDVHNLLYAFSSGNIKNKKEFLDKFPGKEYVDIIGFDTYVYNDDIEAYKKIMQENLSMFKEMALAENKLFAVTETGYESIPSTTWYSGVVYPIMKESGASWVLFWRNANTKHHYVPYPGDTSAEDFKTFYGFPETLFEKDFSKIKN